MQLSFALYLSARSHWSSRRLLLPRPKGSTAEAVTAFVKYLASAAAAAHWSGANLEPAETYTQTRASQSFQHAFELPVETRLERFFFANGTVKFDKVLQMHS